MPTPTATSVLGIEGLRVLADAAVAPTQAPATVIVAPQQMDEAPANTSAADQLPSSIPLPGQSHTPLHARQDINDPRSPRGSSSANLVPFDVDVKSPACDVVVKAFSSPQPDRLILPPLMEQSKLQSAVANPLVERYLIDLEEPGDDDDDQSSDPFCELCGKENCELQRCEHCGLLLCGACQEAEGDVREAFEVEMPPVDCIVCQMPLEQRADDEADYDSERTDTDNEDIHPECHAACYPLFVWFDELKTPASDIASDIDAKSQQPLQEPVNLGKTTTCTEMMCLPCQPQMKKMKLVHSA